ncbi:MAG: glycosyltransferase [Planctomycetes bacterium]|nr:glycosyltransferase [Planctomycetota bacterium]
MENAQQTNKKLNIAFIIYRFGQNVGGAERVAHELSKRIIARGHELHIFSYSFHDVTNITAVFHTVPITKNPYFYRRYSFACNVRDILKDYNFDVTQSFGRTFGCDIYRFGSGIHSKYLETTKKSLLSKMLARVNPKHILENKLEKESMKPNSFKILVAVSNIEKAALVQKYNIPENKIIVVHNGVDTQRFHPRNKEL